MTATGGALQGVWVDLLNPLNEDFSISHKKLATHVKTLGAKGVAGIVMFGHGGEGQAFSAMERLEAVKQMMAHGVAGNLAGGTHHAYADKGGGFCVFNDIAVTARLMQAEAWRHRRLKMNVAVIDLDVHQGNGTAAIFAKDPSVFTLSLHGEKNFPFRKEPSDLDVGLPDGCTDEPYLAALHQALQSVQDRFDPHLVIYLAGADPHEGDRLGRLKLTADGMQARDRVVMDWAWQRRLPVVLCMGGGYGHDIETTVQVQTQTWGVALDHWARWQRWHNLKR